MNLSTSWNSCRQNNPKEWNKNSSNIQSIKPQSIVDHNPRPGMGTVLLAAKKNSLGFTLIELMIALGIMAIFATIALPRFDQLVLNFRLKSATDLFYTEIVSARTEAIKRGSTVILCRTGDPLDLNDGNNTPECRSNIYPSGLNLPSKDWSYGWLAYATKPDFNGERNYTPSDNDVLLRVSDSTISNFDVTVMSNNIGNSWITFQGDGTLNESGLVQYALCDKRGVNEGFLITVFLDGEARIDSLPTTTVNSCSPPNA